MSNTKAQNLKIQKTNKYLLNEYKEEVLRKIEYNSEKDLSLDDRYRFEIYYNLLRGCECNKATIDFIKQQLK